MQIQSRSNQILNLKDRKNDRFYRQILKEKKKLFFYHYNKRPDLNCFFFKFPYTIWGGGILSKIVGGGHCAKAFLDLLFLEYFLFIVNFGFIRLSRKIKSVFTFIQFWIEHRGKIFYQKICKLQRSLMKQLSVFRSILYCNFEVIHRVFFDIILQFWHLFVGTIVYF